MKLKLKFFVGAVTALAFSAGSFASLPASQNDLASKISTEKDEKICLVVRKSIYGKYRKKCKDTQEWMTFLAEYGPKIEQQLATAGSLRKTNGEAIFPRAPQIAYKEK